jgi:hypothetical protein
MYLTQQPAKCRHGDEVFKLLIMRCPVTAATTLQGAVMHDYGNSFKGSFGPKINYAVY